MTDAGLVLAVTASVGAATLPWWWRTPVVTGRPGPRPPAAAPAALPPLDEVLLLDLLEVAIGAGASVPHAVTAVGAAVGGTQGDALVRGGTALLLGSSWESAWSGAAPAGVIGALEASWTTGSAPGPALRGLADHLRRERRTRLREAAGSLGVRLVLPLGLCFLPAFVLLGLVPMLLSLAGDLLG